MAEHVERIGARIRARREELGLSRRKLAQKMAGVVTENDIYRWERGQHKPGDDKLEALASALEVDVSYFMLPEPQPGTPDLMGTLNGDDRLHELAAKLDAANERLDKMLGLLDALPDSVHRLVSGALQDASAGEDASAPPDTERPSTKKPAVPRRARAPRKRKAS